VSILRLSHVSALLFQEFGAVLDVGKTLLGFEVDGQESILETSLVQKGGFIKAQGQDPWAERTVVGSGGVAH